MPALLHAKSHFSLGEGCAPVPALVARAVERGHTAVALTDVENLYGQIRFHHAARAAGLRPVTGVELRGGYSDTDSGRMQGRLVLLARDHSGYESLCRIITARRCSGLEGGTDPLRCLDAFPAGLFYLSDDPEVLRRLRAEGVDSGDLRYLAADPSSEPPEGIEAVADPDVVLLDDGDRELHLLLSAIRRRVPLSAPTNGDYRLRTLPGAEEMARRFAARPALLDAAAEVAACCRLDLTGSAPALPVGDFPDASRAHEALARRCRDQLDGTDPIRTERLELELGVLGKLGFAGYFLIVAEIAAQARSQGIAMTGRGSAAGSLVAYLLGITGVDPIEHGLCFERFLHPDRHDLPDIDLDVASDRRDELLDWVFRRFGEGRVAMVAAHQTFGRRAAFREGLKAFGMDLAGIDRFIQGFPPGELEGEATGPLPLRLLPPGLQAVVPLIERLVGAPRHLSVHPGGVVIADDRVDLHAPLERAPKGVPVTQYDGASLSRLGLVKLDLLGNRALAANAEALRLIGRPVAMTDGDPETVAALRAGNTVGCFQIETPVTRGVLKRMPVRGMADLVAALAVVRPGPAAGEAKAEFLRRANGEHPRQPPHPRLRERLRDTYGMMLFDEDLMAAVSGLTGWSLGAADELRVGLIESSPGDSARRALKRRFLVAASLAGVARGDGERVWQTLERFAAYSFSKAHATSYARLAWESAFLKTHHPAEFACGVLNCYGGHYPLRAVASDLVRCGVRILAPHVNQSGPAHRLESGAVRLGLSAVKCLTARNRERILERRPFTDLRGLVATVPLSAAELESLILSGACDDLAPLIGAAYPFPHEELLTRWKREPGLKGLDGFVARNARGRFAETYRTLSRIRNELRFLGMHPSAHPMRVLREEAEREGCVTTSELANRGGQQVRLAAVVIASRRLADRTGRLMQFVTLEDETGLAESVLSAATFAALQDPVSSAGPLLVSGWVEDDGGSLQLAVTEVKPFHLRPAPYAVAEAV
jgi:DNA-directed DNA polymerase III PolC